MESEVKPVIKKSTSTKTKRIKCKTEEPQEGPAPVNTSKLIDVSKKLVKVQYPGLVRNVDRALDTLGGLKALEMAVANYRNKLELTFHPNNKFNKGALADKDNNPGILLKITEKQQGVEKLYDYEPIGVTVMNFSFNKYVDFQFLPLLSKGTETPESDVEYVYNKIFPNKVPTVEWFLSPECRDQAKFLIPAMFSRFEYSNQSKLHLNINEKFENQLRPDVANSVMSLNRGKRQNTQSRPIPSMFVSFNKRNATIPDQPSVEAMQQLKEKQLEDKYKQVKQLFDERPCLTKAGVIYKTGITNEHIKFILPTVAYFCAMGPWRMSWIRFGYNPQKDSQSRIYQTLDYRIRAAEGTKLKVNAKRSYSSKALFYYFSRTSLTNVSLNDKPSRDQLHMDERSYILTPTTIPPARQMFYHFCDIHIPEIQGMLARLPKAHSEADYDVKNGWLPYNFIEQCREKANQCVLTQVQQQLLEDNRKMREKTMKTTPSGSKQFTPTYCSEMLSNIKKGLYKSVQMECKPGTSKQMDLDEENVIDTIDLLEDDDGLEQVNADEVIAQTIPEHLEENSSDDEMMSQSSDFDIDMEAVEEVNKMITGIETNAGESDMASYLKKL